MAYENGHGKLKTYGKNPSLARIITLTIKFLKNLEYNQKEFWSHKQEGQRLIQGVTGCSA